jgi:hypothetical protein
MRFLLQARHREQHRAGIDDKSTKRCWSAPDDMLDRSPALSASQKYPGKWELSGKFDLMLPEIPKNPNEIKEIHKLCYRISGN